MNDHNEQQQQEVINRLKGFSFSCVQCSDCCRKDPGAVFLTDEDARLICEHLDMPMKQFLKQCCRPIHRNETTIVALLEKVNYDCIFWSESCIIYEARPLQCRTYPFWPGVLSTNQKWQEEAKRCPGIGQQSTLTLEEKIRHYLDERGAIYMEMPDLDNYL